MSRKVILAIAILSAAVCAFAQEPPTKGKGKAPARGRSPLFLKEEWKQIPGGGEHDMVQGHVSNPNLEITLYGDKIEATGTEGDENNPVHAWTGLCEKPCGLTLKDKKNYADLTGLARMKWVTKMSGFHQIRPIVKLADGTWLVGDHADGSVTDWLESDFSLADVKWMKMDIKRLVTTGSILASPDLTKVDEIGFVDLMPSSGHGPGGWADVGKIEVYAKQVAR